MIWKDMSEITYADIETLLINKVDESEILDYKVGMVKDADLVKHVCAFANMRGGHIVFGVKEPGKGGHPTDIPGLDMEGLNKERLEQIVLSNVVPRLDVKTKLIPIPDSEKGVLLVRVPDSHLKPHQSNMTKKFYRRSQYESAEMSEMDVADCYRSRFSNYDQLGNYVRGILPGSTKGEITASIIVIPLNIRHRLVDASDSDQIKTLVSIRIDTNFGGHDRPNIALKPFSHGLISAYSETDKLQIHRNGCVQYICHYRDKSSDTIFLPSASLAERTMQILQFANKILSHYNYFGDVKIIETLISSSKSALYNKNEWSPEYTVESLDNIMIEREHPVHYIETKYEQVASSIMNEIFNHYGAVKCPLFDESGNYVGT